MPAVPSIWTRVGQTQFPSRFNSALKCIKKLAMVLDCSSDVLTKLFWSSLQSSLIGYTAEQKSRSDIRIQDVCLEGKNKNLLILSLNQYVLTRSKFCSISIPAYLVISAVCLKSSLTSRAAVTEYAACHSQSTVHVASTTPAPDPMQ